jgi:hypothetical protein
MLLKIVIITQIHIFIDKVVPTELVTRNYLRQSKEMIKHKAVFKVALSCLVNVCRIAKDIRAQNPILKTEFAGSTETLITTINLQSTQCHLSDYHLYIHLRENLLLRKD